MTLPLLAPLGVIPIIVGPLQVLLAMLPAILVGVGTAMFALFKPRTLKLLLHLLWRTKLTVGLVVAGVLAVGWGVREWRSRSVRGGVQAAEQGDWTMFRGNAARTGSVVGGASPAAGGVNWAFDRDAKTFHSSPTLVGNRLYASSAEIGALTDKGSIYCLDADTGALLWQSTPPKYRATFSSPSVQGKYLVVGEGLHLTKEARILCLDIERGGEVVWSYRTKSHVESSPAIAGGRVYVGAGDDGYYCFELEPGPGGEPRMVWHLEGARYPDAETSPVVDGDRVYFGLGINGHAVVCADAATGKEIWRVETGAPVFTPPMVYGGRLYVGMGHGNFIENEEQVIAKTRERLRAEGKSEEEIARIAGGMRVEGAVWCIDLATHEVAWKFETDRTVLNAVVGAEEGVFVASRGGTVYALSHEGKETGRWEAHTPIIASPSLSDSHLYVVTQAGRLHGLDRRTLKPVWEVVLGEGEGFVSSPAVGRGRAYVGTPQSGLVCVGKPGDVETAGPAWGGHLGGAGYSGWLDGSPLPDRGTLLWSHPKEAEIPASTAPVAVVEKRIYQSVRGGDRPGLRCLTFDPASREPPQLAWERAFAGGLVHSVAVDRAGVYVAAADGEAGGAALFALDPATGLDRWKVPLDGAVPIDGWGAVALTSAGLLVESAPGHLHCFDPAAGTPRWEARLKGSVSGTAAADGAIVWVATRSPDTLQALDAETGIPLWSCALPVQPVGGPVPSDSLLHVGTASGLLACRVENGSLAWRADIGGVSVAPVVEGGRLAVTTDAGEVVVVLRADGSVVERLPGATPGFPPVLGREQLLYVGPEGWMLRSAEGEAPRRWMATAWLGSITSPAVVSGSGLLFTTDKRGLIRAGRYR